MKRVIISTGSFFGHENAMSNAVLPLLTSLQKNYEVDIFALSPNDTLPLEENIDGFHIFRNKMYGGGISKWIHKAKYLLYRIRGLDTRAITKRRYISFAKAIVYLLNLISDTTFNTFMMLGEKELWYHSIEQLITNHSYDCVISISSPIRNQVDCLKISKKGLLKNTKWIAYYLDPFATYKGNLEKKCAQILMDFEMDVYKNATAILTTPEIKADNLHYNLAQFDNKVYPVQLANLHLSQKQTYDPYPFDSSKINCVFTGSFFDISIRNPLHLFEVIAKCPETIQFYVVCYLSNPIVEKYKETYLKEKPNVHWMTRLPIQTCFSMMHSADILINVGNESLNQTPSKIFDYISIGKPIVNFYSLEGDTSNHYLESYPCYLSICNNEDALLSYEKFETFVTKSKTTVINCKELERNYASLSSDTISSDFVRTIQQILSNL